jgi:hypothetical protein
MKTQPIILDGPTIRAILDGNMAELRFPVNPQPTRQRVLLTNHPQQSPTYTKDDDWIRLKDGNIAQIGSPAGLKTCPYGSPGDRLWVQETWAVTPALNNLEPSQIDPKWTIIPGTEGPAHATIRVYKEGYRGYNPWPGTKWRSPDCMPRWASRLTLEITAAGVEWSEEKDKWVWVVGIEKVEKTKSEAHECYD